MARTPRQPIDPSTRAPRGAAEIAGTPAAPQVDPKSVTTTGQVLSPPGPSMDTTPNINQSWGPIPVLTDGMTFYEIGQTGLRQFSGWIREEFLQVLVGRQAAQKYREMMDNNPTIGGMLFAIQSTMRKVEWRVLPPEETGGSQEYADFIDSCRNDMSHSWEDLVTENLSMLPFGFAFHELVYKRRMGRDPGMDPRPNYYGEELPKSDYEDGKIGWRRIPGRSQDTIIKWFFDRNGQTKGVTQQPWVGPLIDIPIEKSLIFRPVHYKMNPEGRPCTLDTKVRTPRGWTTMGEIAIGEEVYDETGAIRKVTGKSEVFKDRPVYEIEFMTGATIQVDACHLWRISDYNDRTHGRTRDVTTEQIAAFFDAETQGINTCKLPGPRRERWKNRRPRSICCGVAPILQSPEVSLPLDPYILGYWLGDGMTSKAAISVQKKDLFSLQAELERCGFLKSRHDGSTNLQVPGGLLLGLRAAGVLNNKHVPQSYMLASPDQRLALLQGLMDSDGYSPGTDSKDEASTFANTNRRLVDAVAELVRSLGGQPRTRILEEVGAVGGIINGHTIVAKQTSYEVRFMLDLPVHRLPRKRHAQVLRKTNRNSGHFIRSVQRIGNADTVCIEVDSPSHLFLAGESMVPTHNSILRNAYVSYYFTKRLQEQEAILFERLGGVPVIYIPGQLLAAANDGDPSAVATVNLYKKIAINLRTDEQMGLVLPSDPYKTDTGYSNVKQYEFQLVSPQMRAASINLDQTINRYSISMLTSVLADFLTLGHEARGTQSLAVTKVDMFMQAVEGYLNSMAAVYNKYAIPRLLALNGMNLDQSPRLEPDMAQRVDLDVLSNFILRISQAGMPLFPDEELQHYIKDAAGLPDVDDSRALQAAGLTDDQLDREDDKQDAMLENIKNPPQSAVGRPVARPGGPGGGNRGNGSNGSQGRSQAQQDRDQKQQQSRKNLELMIAKAVADRMVRLSGPRFGVTTHRHEPASPRKRFSRRGLTRLSRQAQGE